MLVKKVLTAGLGGVLILFLGTAVVLGVECTGSTYSSADFKEVQSLFSPYEKVFVTVVCSGLEAGEHVMHANWMHKKRGMIRSDTHDFKMDINGDRFVFFWFKLSRKGPFSSALTNKDFHEENFGEWVVESYLDDSLVSTSKFKILPGGQ
jgi:hypothetical protein